VSLTLPLTILVEGIVICGFALWRKKPFGELLVASLIANLLTQFLLWEALNLFPGFYLPTLLVMELFIWLMESAFLHYFPNSRLAWREALALSLGMNLASFGAGWFLPF
jgi:hypothetical protein